MKAYFSVLGIGLGHMARSLAIAEGLREEGVECVFSSYGKAAHLAEKNGFKTYDSKPLMWYQEGNGRVNVDKTLLKSPLMFQRMTNHFRKESRRIKKENPEVVIIDSRYSSIPASKYKCGSRIYITNQPRILLPRENGGSNMLYSQMERMSSWLNYKLLSGQDEVLLPDFPLPDSISERHMRFSNAPQDFIDKTSFVGPIAPHRPGSVEKEEIEAVCDKYGVEPGRYIYIAFSGPQDTKEELHDAIFHLFPDYEIPAIVGTGKPGEFNIRTKGNLKLVDGWIDSREALMKGAELVISRAGLCTVSEILAFGKKAVIIPQSNQPEQVSNARGAQKLGIAKMLKPEDTSEKNLREAIEVVRKSPEVEKATKRLKKKAREWNGESKSIEIIMDHLEQAEAN